MNSDSDYIRERNKGNSLTLVVLEAVAAVDGAVVSRLERDLGGCPALRADRVKHLAVVAARGFAACAAVLAANGFVLESLLRVKLLLAGRKDKFLTTILAYQCLVLEHFRFFPFSVDENSDIRVPADLVFAPTPANWKCRYPAMCLSLLPLSKCMFRYASVGLTSRPHHAHGALPAYVDRFACDWHRFSTTDPIRGYQKHYSSNICKIAMYFLNKMYEQMRFCAVFSTFMRSNAEIMRKKQGRVALRPCRLLP